jgi:hypothetical protein
LLLCDFLYAAEQEQRPRRLVVHQGPALTFLNRGRTTSGQAIVSYVLGSSVHLFPSIYHDHRSP